MTQSAAELYEAWSRKSLEHALSEVPGYASWRALDPGPHTPIDARYAALPTLTKQALRDHFPHGFIPGNRDFDQGMASGEIELAQTSGSTEDRVTLIFHSPWWEASEQASWQLNRHARLLATGSHPEAVLASPLCVGPGYAPHPQAMKTRILGRHLYLNEKINPATWTSGDIRRMADELASYQPVVLEADPAYLSFFARRALALNLELYQPRLIFLTYSFPSRLYHRRIRSAFSAPIASSYGSTETGHVFLQCEAGRLHQNVAHCRVDFQPWAPRWNRPDHGRMLVTVFHNPWFSVLRFDIGDIACLDTRGPCPCGRRDGLTLSSIAGRTKDVTFTPEGLPVTVDDLDDALSGIEGLEGWQLDHLQPAAYHLRLLHEGQKNLTLPQHCRERLAAVYGPAAVITVEPGDALKHEPSGKFRFARTFFPVDHDALWRNRP